MDTNQAWLTILPPFKNYKYRHVPFLKAVLNYWHIFTDEGNKYMSIGAHKNDIWKIHSNIKYVLANMGIPTDILNSQIDNLDLVIKKYNLL